MLARSNSICFLPSWVDACALWRLYMPYTCMEGTSFFAFKQPIFQMIFDKDIAVVQRCYSQGQFNFIRTCKRAGMKVIMDLDDDVWHIPPHNPAHDMLDKCKDGFVACMTLVDAVTVSTKQLARIVTSCAKPRVPVIVVENRISQKLFAKPTKAEQVIVGWAGSISHQGLPGQPGTGDLGIIENVILQAAREYPDVRFEFRGATPISDLTQLENVKCFKGVPVAEYAARMPVWGWHISLAPVTKHEFNRSKSGIKMIEAAYCKIPCLATWIDPYDRFVSFDEELKWLLCIRENDWATKLRILINEPARRDYLGARMHKVMLEHFSYDKRHEGWNKAIAAVK